MSIQQSINSALGSVAVGAIAKTSVDKIKTDLAATKGNLAKTEGVLEATRMEAKETEEYLLAGGDETGFTAAERQAQEQAKKFKEMPTVDSTRMDFTEKKVERDQKVVSKQKQNVQKRKHQFKGYGRGAK